MEGLLQRVLARIVRHGSLDVILASGKRITLGDGTGAPLTIRITSSVWERQIFFDPELKLGEAYMEGGLVIEQGDIAEVLALLMSQVGLAVPSLPAKAFMRLRYLFRRLAQFNPPGRSQANVAHHYDLDGRLYSLFLDADRQYSCAYFEHPGQSLDDAQLAKRRHIAAKLIFDRRDLSVLDIGCGWGGMGLYLA